MPCSSFEDSNRTLIRNGQSPKPSVLRGMLRFRNRRHPDYDFGILKRDELQPLAAAEVVGRDAVARRLEELVVAQLLFEPRGNGHQRSYPVRLLALDLGDARKPVYESSPRSQTQTTRCFARGTASPRQARQPATIVVQIARGRVTRLQAFS